jgi:hypothetical protein
MSEVPIYCNSQYPGADEKSDSLVELTTPLVVYSERACIQHYSQNEVLTVAMESQRYKH